MSGRRIGGTHLRKIGWAAVLIVCLALYLGLHLRVNAVKSEVRQAERYIIALKEQKLLLETEFQTRSNQQQLANWNQIEFGYVAPKASQFLEGERQLAQFGMPRAHGAPEPIRVARLPTEREEGTAFADLVSPIAGRAIAAEMPQDNPPAPLARENLAAGNWNGIGRGMDRVRIDLAGVGE